MANRVRCLDHSCYKARKNYRDRDYTVGFWSIAQHLVYRTLSGVLPSGRLAGKPFTPGLTPDASASKNYLENIRNVARLNPKHTDNSIAFNVKHGTAAMDSRKKTSI